MATSSPRASALALLLCACLSASSFHVAISGPPAPGGGKDDFLSCLTKAVPPRLLFAKSSPAYGSVWSSTVRNIKFLSDKTVKPLYIVTPTEPCHIQATVSCGRRHGMRLRVRSGGHDYEGLSYRSVRPETFAVVDLADLRAITITTDGEHWAWVDSGATVGELYHTIGKHSTELAFPAGVCPTLGIGGHLSGGGIGSMMRKYGLSVDNVVDAKLVDANGDLLGSRAAMGEDLFWAIRGGGGESFGVVVSWKLRLVKVPSTVTVLRISRTLEQGAVDAVTKWQHVAPTLPDGITMEVLVQGQQAVFQTLY